MSQGRGAPPPLLEFRDVSIVRGRQPILQSVSLVIPVGQNVAILGPNGAGKSSLIKSVTREYYPRPAGPDFVFRIWGQDRWDVFSLRSRLGIVSNDLQYLCTRAITGRDLILSGFFSSIGLYRQAVTARMREKTAAVLDFLEIRPLQERLMTEMSSGEARRFLIGRALVHDPRALILDEPTVSLDLYALHKFRELMRKITQSGTSVILVTQDLGDIIPEIHRVILMKHGQFVADGDREAVLTDERISALFGLPLRLICQDGHYFALPA